MRERKYKIGDKVRKIGGTNRGIGEIVGDTPPSASTDYLVYFPDWSDGHNGQVYHSNAGFTGNHCWYILESEIERIKTDDTISAKYPEYPEDALPMLIDSAKKIVSQSGCSGVPCGQCPCSNGYTKAESCSKVHGNESIEFSDYSWFCGFLEKYDQVRRREASATSSPTSPRIFVPCPSDNLEFADLYKSAKSILSSL